MTSPRGDDRERWPLARAVDALGEAARRAGLPSLLWIAGIAYPGLNLGFLTAPHFLLVDDGAWGAGLDVSGFALPLAGLIAPSWLVALAVLLPLYSRLTAGLARVAPAEAWARAGGERGRPSLRSAWRGGRGITLAALGMWVLLAALFLVAAVGIFVVIGLVARRTGGDLVDGALALVVVPLIGLLSLYALVISILHQLALHSLTHNRRGVGSALAHAWVLARHDPWATARTVALDVVLQVVVYGGTLAILLPLVPLGLAGLAAVPALLLNGFAGVTRAAFWAAAYRGLGGLSPADGVPGLHAEAEEAALTPEADPEAWRRLV